MQLSSASDSGADDNIIIGFNVILNVVINHKAKRMTKQELF